MFDRLLMTRSGWLRMVLVVLALPVVWFAWLGWMMAAGIVDRLHPVGRR